MDSQDEFRSDPRHIRECERCSLRYDWRKSPSVSLKMTYCSSLCERADLGFTIEALLRIERNPAAVRPAVQLELAAAA